LLGLSLKRTHDLKALIQSAFDIRHALIYVAETPIHSGEMCERSIQDILKLIRVHRSSSLH
jgi:hypothetical protein